MSYSWSLRSEPVYQPQLNMTDFRSLAPGAGLKYCGPPRPRPRPWPSPAWPAGPGPPPAGACAPARDGAPMVSAATNAALVQMRCRRKVMMIPLCRLVGFLLRDVVRGLFVLVADEFDHLGVDHQPLVDPHSKRFRVRLLVVDGDVDLE